MHGTRTPPSLLVRRPLSRIVCSLVRTSHAAAAAALRCPARLQQQQQLCHCQQVSCLSLIIRPRAPGPDGPLPHHSIRHQSVQSRSLPLSHRSRAFLSAGIHTDSSHTAMLLLRLREVDCIKSTLPSLPPFPVRRAIYFSFSLTRSFSSQLQL
jgi:hypothetical protein